MEEIKRMHENGLLKRNLNKPIIKDTVTVPVGGYTIIRFVADNPGIWLFHCHLEFHSEIGMAFIIKTGNEKDYIHSKPKNWPQCGDYSFEDEAKFAALTSLANNNKIRNKINNKILIFLLAFVNF